MQTTSKSCTTAAQLLHDPAMTVQQRERRSSNICSNDANRIGVIVNGMLYKADLPCLQAWKDEQRWVA